MLVFKGDEDPEEVTPETPKPKAEEKPKGPIWARKARDYSGRELLEETRIQLGFQSKDNKLAPWLDRVADEFGKYLELADQDRSRINFLQNEIDRLRSEAYKREQPQDPEEDWEEDFDSGIFEDAMEDDADYYSKLGRSLRNQEGWI